MLSGWYASVCAPGTVGQQCRSATTGNISVGEGRQYRGSRLGRLGCFWDLLIEVRHIHAAEEITLNKLRMAVTRGISPYVIKLRFFEAPTLELI
jgi:hypothetical protein